MPTTSPWVGYVVRMAPARLPRRRLFWNHSGEADQKDNACAEGALARGLPIISVSLDEAGRADIHDRQERSRVVEALCGSFATSQE